MFQVRSYEIDFLIILKSFNEIAIKVSGSGKIVEIFTGLRLVQILEEINGQKEENQIEDIIRDMIGTNNILRQGIIATEIGKGK